MTSHDWKRVKDIFLGALERRPEELTSYLSEACGDNESLRSEIERLLAHDSKTGDFLVPPERTAVV